VKDAYTWGAIYTDGSSIGEYDDPGGLGFAAVDSTQVKRLGLLNASSPHLASHSVDIPPGATPIFFRRRSIELGPIVGEEQGRSTVHCIGWKRGDEAVYLFVYDDGSTLLTNDLQAV
jgi:hypothetical protein